MEDTGRQFTYMQFIKPGLYRHFKGNYYTVLGTATNTETNELLVIYRAEYGDKKLFARPLEMFIEKVNHFNRILDRFEFQDDLKEKVKIVIANDDYLKHRRISFTENERIDKILEILMSKGHSFETIIRFFFNGNLRFSGDRPIDRFDLEKVMKAARTYLEQGAI